MEEIAEIIGVDSLGYLSVEHLLQIVDGCEGFCTACFGGAYPTAIRDGAIRTGLNEKSGKGSRPRRETYERLCRGRERLERSEDGT